MWSIGGGRSPATCRAPPVADDPGRSRRGDYRAARIGAATALIAAAVFIVVYDAFSDTYEVNILVLTVLIAAVLTFLGLEANAILRGGPK